jgi:hypothetical protein
LCVDLEGLWNSIFVVEYEDGYSLTSSLAAIFPFVLFGGDFEVLYFMDFHTQGVVYV